MRFSPTGVPYDICPFCHQKILPKEMGGRQHINEHRIPEANRLFASGKSITAVNAELLRNGITLFANIPPKMRNVTIRSELKLNDNLYHMVGFDYYENIRLQDNKNRKIRLMKLWDRRFLANVEVKE